MILMTETVKGVNILHEEVNGKKELFIEGVFLESERKNRNGRIYPKAIMEREVNKYRNDYINTNRALGELEHPKSATVNPDRVSHLIVGLTEDGDSYRGKAKILDTPCGNIVRGIVEGGAQIGVSSRGLGSVKMKNGINEVQNDFDLCTIDAVLNPSAIDAFVNGIMENEVWIPKTDLTVETQDGIKQLTSKQLKDEVMMLRMFEHYMSKL